MGNVRSCFDGGAKKAVVITTDGTHHAVLLPTNCAETMALLSCEVGQFLVDLDEVVEMRCMPRSPMSAECKLQPHGVYVCLTAMKFLELYWPEAPPFHGRREFTDEEVNLMSAVLDMIHKSQKDSRRVFVPLDLSKHVLWD